MGALRPSVPHPVVGGVADVFGGVADEAAGREVAAGREAGGGGAHCAHCALWLIRAMCAQRRNVIQYTKPIHCPTAMRAAIG